MYVIFLIPLALSFVAALFAVLWDVTPRAKCAIIALVALAALLQFVPALRESVHFLVPLFLQLFACGIYLFAMRPY